MPAPPVRPRPAPQRLSYSALAAYARCGYRFYLQRLLGLPRVTPPPPDAPAEPAAATNEPVVGGRGGDPAAAGEEGISAMLRGSLVHRLLEDLDFKRPQAPDAAAVRELGAEHEVELTAEEVEDIRGLVAAFAASPLCRRLAAVRRTRRELPFAFGLEPAGGGPLVTGFVDALAVEPDGGVLIVDYKSDRLEDQTPEQLVERDYATQRTVYALAALRDGAPKVEVAHCFLERPGEPVTRAYTAADAPALAEQLATAAAGLLEGRYPVTPTPHRELCQDCPGRAALCSWPETITLTPAPNASPEAADRRTPAAAPATAAGR